MDGQRCAAGPELRGRVYAADNGSECPEGQHNGDCEHGPEQPLSRDCEPELAPVVDVKEPGGEMSDASHLVTSCGTVV